jgi:hypothetical protein
MALEEVSRPISQKQPLRSVSQEHDPSALLVQAAMSEEPTTEPVTEEPKAPDGMSVYLRTRLAHKHRKDLAALQLALEAGPVTMESLMEKYGWCRTRAHNMLSTAFLLGAIKAVPQS